MAYTPDQLKSLDVAFGGRPFVQVTNGTSDGSNLDVVYGGQPFGLIYVTAAGGLTPQRAILISSGTLAQITTAQVGTSLKPIVWYNNTITQRVASEGTPIIWDGTKLRLLNATTETLTI
jgi:hypothetical protein